MIFKRTPVALALASALFSFGAGAAVPPVKFHSLHLQAQGVNLKATNPLIGPDGKADVIIILKGEPATHSYARALQGSGSGPLGLTAANNAAKATIATLKSQQTTFVGQLHSHGIGFSEIYRVQRVLNGVAVRMKPADMEKVRKLPNVERVQYLTVYERPQNIASVPFVNAPDVWDGYNQLNLLFNATGKGVKIGDIDTGLDFVHPDFGGSGLLADYQDIDPTSVIGKNSHNIIFPTGRVKGGYDFAGDAYVAGTTPAPDANPMDCGGHGTHTAGTLAGGGVNGDGTAYTGPYNTVAPYTAGLSIGPGMAPEADLYALRVFGCGGSTDLVTAAIDWATDPNQNGELSDHLDVINMSLGSNFGVDIADPGSEIEAVNNAALVGMISVSAAGNAGDTTFIASAPGAAAAGIMAAASVDSSIPGVVVTETTPNSELFPANASAYANPANPQPPGPAGQSGNVVLVNDTSGGTHKFCTTISNAAAITGNFALIDRGSCTFVTKVQNAQAAGATGVIIADNSGSPIPIVMGGTATVQITIPAVSVSTASGATLKTEQASNTTNVTFTAANAGDTLASFSSRGPVGGANGAVELRPDIAAPGLNIPSAQTGYTCDNTNTFGCITPDPSGFLPGGQVLTISGTSMATPHIAGMMALLRQLNPTATVEELKAMAINGASHKVTLGANAAPPQFGATRVGAGRIDAAASAASTLLAYNADVPGSVSVTFDVEPVGGAFQASHNVTLSNLAATDASVTLAVDDILAAPGVSYSVPSGTIVVPANSTYSFSVTLNADTSLMTWSFDPSMGPTQSSTALGTFPRQFMSEASSILKVQDSVSTTELARLPLYAAARPHSTLATPNSLGISAPTSGTTGLTLSGSDVCTPGVVAGPTCPTAVSTDEESLVWVFEQQVTGAKDSTLPGWANVHYVGINSAPDVDSSSNPTTDYFFGVSTYGRWGTPNYVSFNVCIDSDNDGLFDKILSNANTGTIDALFFGSGAANDVSVGFFYDNVTSNAGFDFFTNLFPANAFDTALNNNNTMILGIQAAELGIATPGLTPIHYGIAVCPGYNPLCGAEDWTGGGQGTANCGIAGSGAFASFNGPFAYDPTAPGVDGAGDVLLEDLNGGLVDVAYNVNNVVANGSHGMLLLHSHNTDDISAQFVGLDRIFYDGFGN
jgi:subtilisin family serine protease